MLIICDDDVLKLEYILTINTQSRYHKVPLAERGVYNWNKHRRDLIVARLASVIALTFSKSTQSY